MSSLGSESLFDGDILLHEFYRTLYARLGRVDTKVVVGRSAQLLVGIIIVVGCTALIGLLDEILRLILFYIVSAEYSRLLVSHISRQEEINYILPKAGQGKRYFTRLNGLYTLLPDHPLIFIL